MNLAIKKAKTLPIQALQVKSSNDFSLAKKPIANIIVTAGPEEKYRL
ncbi:hypothetical protein [Siminovitchia fordii]|nr:hypothetical protein [Siminovitchia fordii]